MIETVVALLMFVNNEIKEHRIQDSMANNKINIEFLNKQMDKVIEDIEKLKDADRDIKYENGNH